MKRSLPLAAAALLATATMFAPKIRAAIIDNINGSADPAPFVTDAINGDGVGWYYTPSISYNLDGIYTYFAPVSSTLVTPIITVQIQSERPINGGTLLAQGTFQANSADGGSGGAAFSPILLTAGTTYFVDIKNMTGMGVNFGTWQDDSHGNPEPSGGATINLGAFYIDSNNGFSTVRTDAYDFAANGTTPVSGSEPILNFDGTPLPEPSSAVMILITGFACFRRRYRNQ